MNSRRSLRRSGSDEPTSEMTTDADPILTANATVYVIDTVLIP